MPRAITNFDFDRGALRALSRDAKTRAEIERLAEQVQDRARRNAAEISPRLAEAIIATPASVDGVGAYVDVGYDKKQPGWVLWWHEVGTSKYPATPHLRPALKPGS